MCPLCRHRKETNAHIIQCQHTKVREHRGEATQTLQQNLKKIGTHDNLQRLIIGLLHTEDTTKFKGVAVQNTLCQEQIEELCRRQHCIGWKNWESGWWTMAWQETHTYQRQKGFRSKYNGENWAVRAQTLVWTYVKSFWVHRNERVHGSDLEEQRQVRRMRVEAEAKRQYGEKPDVGRSTFF